MKPTQAEFLLRLAENNDARGDEINDEINRLGREHAHALLEEQDLLNKAMELNRQGRERFAHFMPRQPHSSQNTLQQGPRMAIAQSVGGQNEAQAKEQRPQRPASS